MVHDEPTVWTSQYWFHMYKTYIYSRILQAFQNAALNLITTRLEYTLLQYSTTLSSLITSFCIIFDICMMNLMIQDVNYRHLYIYYLNTPSIDIQHAVINLITTRRELLNFSIVKVLSSIINSLNYSCVIFSISATWWTNTTIYIPEYSQYWFQNAAYLITTRREYTLLVLIKHNTSYLISASCCNQFNHCTRRELLYYSILNHDETTYIYSWILPVLISTCCILYTRREFNSVLLSSIITSFCMIFDICYMMNQHYYIYSRILLVLIYTCCNQFNHYKT